MATPSQLLPSPALEHVMHLEIDVGEPVEVCRTSAGARRVVPITGGTVSGPLLTGTVLPGGADVQLLRSETETELEARYVIATDDGERLLVHNRGLRVASAEDAARLRRDEPVDPARVYFRSVPTFEAGRGRLDRLTRHVHVATGARTPRSVLLDVFEVG